MNASAANRKAREGIRAAADLEPRLRSQYQASLRATARRTSAAYRVKSEVVLAAADPSEIRAQPTVDEVFDATAAAASATARTKATRRRLALLAGGPLLVDSILAKAQRDYFAPLVEAQAGAQAERLVAGTRDAVAAVMLDSLTEGWSVPETADALLEKLTLDADWRATMLARTDLVSLSNGASHQAALSHGEAGPQFKRWLTAGDDRVRESHQDASGQTVAIGEPFNVGGAMLNFPGDWLGPDDETINCRCVSVYVASEDAELAYSKSPDPLAVAASAANLEDEEVEMDTEIETTPETEPIEKPALTADASALCDLLDGALSQAASALDAAFTLAQAVRSSYEAEEKAEGDTVLMASVGLADGIEKTPIEVPLGEVGELSTLTAAAAGLAPVAAPSEWFETPEANGPLPLTIEKDGRVYGHAATWGVCHTGKPGGCTTAPRSRSGYDYFHLGVVDTADGMTVPVGRVTLDTGHASLTASRGATAAHYDHTGTQAAYVRARDGEHGIWVSGVLNPDLPESKVRALKAAALSGDWRNVNGALELVGLLAVNVPGFPVPRAQAALAATAGEDVELALVAAGIVCDCAEEDLPPLDLDALIEAEVDPQRLRMAMTSAAA